MAGINAGQPEIRFNKAGPFSFEGVTFPPKTITIKKTVGTQAENEDFWSAPAGTFITRAYAMCMNGSGNTTTQVCLGQDGATTSLITYTNFAMQTAGTFTSYSGGLYLPAGDMLRITVNGTPAASTAYFVIEYFDMAAMYARGVHIDT
jgi:hypothetical protein